MHIELSDDEVAEVMLRYPIGVGVYPIWSSFHTSDGVKMNMIIGWRRTVLTCSPNGEEPKVSYEDASPPQPSTILTTEPADVKNLLDELSDSETVDQTDQDMVNISSISSDSKDYDGDRYDPSPTPTQQNDDNKSSSFSMESIRQKVWQSLSFASESNETASVTSSSVTSSVISPPLSPMSISSDESDTVVTDNSIGFIGNVSSLPDSSLPTASQPNVTSKCRQCVGIAAKTGEQCQKFASPNSSYCYHHC
jgi:hypothetical protein